MPPSGFPVVVDRALQQHRVVVVSLVVPGARVDEIAAAEAEAGAKLSGAGFLALNVLNEGVARALLAKLDSVQDPSVLVIKRSGDVAIELSRIRRSRDGRPGRRERTPVSAVAKAGERELFVRHARKDGRSVAVLRAIDHGDSCVVETEVFPAGAANGADPRPSGPVQLRECRAGDAVRHRGGRGADGPRLRRPGAVGEPVDVGAPLARSSAIPRVAARLATPPFVLAGIVALSSLFQTLLAWRRPTPGYFPDEYMYAELGRSLLESGSPLVRGESAHFLPLLYPLLTAPAWLWDDVEQAYRAIQAVNAVSMSLAAIPAFLLARRLRVGDRLALATAALAVLLPELLYSSSLLAETLAYPLALAAAAAAVAAVERPTLRLQLAVLAFSGARHADAPPAGGAAALLPRRGRRGRAPRPAAARDPREHGLAVGAIALALVAGLGAALAGTVGIYGDVTAYSVEPLVAVKGFGANALVLAYAAGWVIVPGASIGLALALARPRSRAESASRVFAVAALLLLLVQASVVGDAGRVQERYAMYALPLVVVAFALYASRGWPYLRANAFSLPSRRRRRPSFRSPAMPPTARNGQSVVLAGLREIEARLGDVGLASLAVALGASVLSAVVLGVAVSRRRLATPVALAVTARRGHGDDRRRVRVPARRPRTAARDLPPRRPLVGRRGGSGGSDAARRASLDAGRPPQHAVLEPLGPAPRPPRRRRPARRIRRARAGRRRRRPHRPSGRPAAHRHARIDDPPPRRRARRLRADEDALAHAGAAAAGAPGSGPLLQRVDGLRRRLPRLAPRARRPSRRLARARARRREHDARPVRRRSFRPENGSS